MLVNVYSNIWFFNVTFVLYFMPNLGYEFPNIDQNRSKSTRLPKLTRSRDHLRI